MAGQLTIDTLRASTGVLATQNGMTGIAKAWVQFNGTTINGSFNVSSITVNSGGDYTVNYTTAMPNANYAVTGTCGWDGSSYTFLGLRNTGAAVYPPTTTYVRVFTSTTGSTIASNLVSVVINGA